MSIEYISGEMSYDESNELTLEIIKKLDSSLTVNAHFILEELYHHPYMRQKDLSVAIHSSPSSLSNQLSRISSIIPRLIDFEQRGRDKLFFLTSIATAYVKQELQKRTRRTTLFSMNRTSSPQQVQYQGVDIPDRLYQAVMDNSLSHYRNMAPLFELQKDDPESIYKIIDNILVNLYSAEFNGTASENDIYIGSLTEAEYYAIYFSLSKLTSYCISNRLDKALSVQYIKSLIDDIAISYYLAEKVTFIQLHHRH